MAGALCTLTDVYYTSHPVGLGEAEEAFTECRGAFAIENLVIRRSAIQRQFSVIKSVKGIFYDLGLVSPCTLIGTDRL